MHFIFDEKIYLRIVNTYQGFLQEFTFITDINYLVVHYLNHNQLEYFIIFKIYNQFMR